MPTITPTLVQSPHMVDVEIWKWIGLAAGDVALPVICGYKQDKSVWWVAGTVGTAVLTIQGSPDPALGAATFSTVRDPTHTLLTSTLLTTMSHAQILSSCYAIKPVLTGGATTAGLDVYLHIRGR